MFAVVPPIASVFEEPKLLRHVEEGMLIILLASAKSEKHHIAPPSKGPIITHYQFEVGLLKLVS